MVLTAPQKIFEVLGNMMNGLVRVTRITPSLHKAIDNSIQTSSPPSRICCNAPWVMRVTMEAGIQLTMPMIFCPWSARKLTALVI